MRSFVNSNDIIELKKNGINYDEDIIVFLNEMKNYFYKTWRNNNYKDIDKCGNTIEDFNILIGNYPSNGGYGVINKYFDCASEKDLEVLSENTIELLGYFYHIHLY